MGRWIAVVCLLAASVGAGAGCCSSCSWCKSAPPPADAPTIPPPGN